MLPRMAPSPRRKPGVPSFTPAQLPATKLKMLHLSAASYISLSIITLIKVFDDVKVPCLFDNPFFGNTSQGRAFTILVDRFEE